MYYSLDTVCRKLFQKVKKNMMTNKEHLEAKSIIEKFRRQQILQAFEHPVIVQVFPLRNHGVVWHFHLTCMSTVRHDLKKSRNHFLKIIYLYMTAANTYLGTWANQCWYLGQWLLFVITLVLPKIFELRSGDWPGNSRTLKCFLRSHSLVILAVCFGSLFVGRPSHNPCSD